jgi:hypothetical protein
VAAGVAVVAVAGATTAAIVARDSSSKRVTIVAPADPAVVSVLPPAPVGDNITVSPAGPYGPGDRAYAVATVTATESFRVDDPGNSNVELCFRYGAGELCDATVRTHYVSEHEIGGPFPYEVWLPGWVHTPTGLRPCNEVGCRLEFQADDGSRVGTPPLAIEPGPRPSEPLRLLEPRFDRISAQMDGLLPDPSYAAADLPPEADFPPGGLAICAFAERLLCDGLVQPDPPPFDGRPHALAIPTNRELLTSRGWVDCVEHVCALVLTRNTNVTNVGGGIGSDAETLAIVPYRLPPATPAMARPTLTVDSPGPYEADELVPVTLHDPPAHTDPARLVLGVCRVEDGPDVGLGCGSELETWTRLPDGSLRQEVHVGGEACAPPGCYFAILPPVKGHPQVARTEVLAI